MIKEIFIKTFNIIKYNLILVQPLLIFLLIIGFIMGIISSASGSGAAFIILFASLIGLLVAFFTGWFNMFHKCIQNSLKENLNERERAENSLKLFKEFTPGIGRHFTQVFLGFAIYIILFILVINLSGMAGQQIIGTPESFTQQEVIQAFQSEDAARKLIEQITPEDKVKITKWQLLTLITTGLFNYFTMFWLPAIISDNKDPINAYKTSFKKVMKKPTITFALFTSFWVCSIFLTFFNGLTANNFFLQFIGLMLYVFVVVYFITMLFLYYEQYSEDNNSSWTNSFR